MKHLQLITLILIVVGGLQFVLSAIGINLLGHIIGGHVMLFNIIIGASMLYWGIPMLKQHMHSTK